MLPYELPPFLGPTILCLVCAAALAKGEWEERLTAMGLLVNVALTLLLRDYSWPKVQNTGLAIDAAFLVVLVLIAFKSVKFWPIMASSCQVVSVVIHIAKMTDPHIQQWAYITGGVVFTYVFMIILSIGVWNCSRARYRAAAAREAPATATRR
jgi:hypothetical protein